MYIHDTAWNDVIYNFVILNYCVSNWQNAYLDEIGLLKLFDNLADGDEISNALEIGIPLIIVGLLIAYFSMWRNKDNEKGSTIGCIGIVIIGIGLFALLPLWTWVEAIGVTLVNVIIGIGIIFAIIYYIYKALKK